MAIYPLDEEILPPNRMRRSISWRDIIEAQDQLVIQFSAAENLSKDPSQRAQQVMMLANMGAIPQSRIASLMEIPDSVQGYSLANNAINAVMAVIDDCLENDKMEVPDYVPTDMLKTEIMNTMLSLRAVSNPQNAIDIEKMKQLYQLVLQKEGDSQTAAEMVAVQTLQQEFMADLQNPDGQFATQMNKALQEQI